MFATGRAARGESPVSESDPEESERDAPDREGSRECRPAGSGQVCVRRRQRGRDDERRRAQIPKSDAESTRAANRVRGRSGSVRTNRSQGDSRSAAIPTPNWKNATARTANPANEASRRVGSASASRRDEEQEEQRGERERRHAESRVAQQLERRRAGVKQDEPHGPGSVSARNASSSPPAGALEDSSAGDPSATTLPCESTTTLDASASASSR